MRTLVLVFCMLLMVSPVFSHGDDHQHDSNQTAGERGEKPRESFSFLPEPGYTLLAVETVLVVFGVWGAYRIRREKT